MQSDLQETVIRDVLLADQPTKRFVKPEEIAALVRHLCSDDAQSFQGKFLSSCSWLLSLQRPAVHLLELEVRHKPPHLDTWQMRPLAVLQAPASQLMVAGLQNDLV